GASTTKFFVRCWAPSELKARKATTTATRGRATMRWGLLQGGRHSSDADDVLVMDSNRKSRARRTPAAAASRRRPPNLREDRGLRNGAVARPGRATTPGVVKSTRRKVERASRLTAPRRPGA